MEGNDCKRGERIESFKRVKEREKGESERFAGRFDDLHSSVSARKGERMESLEGEVESHEVQQRLEGGDLQFNTESPRRKAGEAKDSK